MHMGYILTEEAIDTIKSSKDLRAALAKLFDWTDQNIMKIIRLNKPDNDLTKLVALELLQKLTSKPFRQYLTKVK